jgi:DNA-3-methyladenine glycosylase II
MPLLEIPQPYDFEVSTERFRAFGPDLANLWHEGGLLRVVGGREVRIEAAPGGVLVDQLDAEIEAEVGKLLGLPFDLAAFYRWARRADPLVRRVASALAGFRPPLAPSPFESLVTSISAQQVSLHAAFAIRNRLIERFGERGDHAFSFPTRERLTDVDEDELFSLGFSRRKAEYIVGLSRSDLDLEALASLPDDEVKARITAVRGLGEWTADWFLARHLARPRAWAPGDLGVRKAIAAFYGDEDPRTVVERFDPFQNLTVHYLLTGARVLG